MLARLFARDESGGCVEEAGGQMLRDFKANCVGFRICFEAIQGFGQVE